ncbi:MAG TPA: archaetidylserine decarboxylase [bacterium]|nr:archaetidylserine decarboxylase [bacterium]HQG46886.1 archaetidylserine decarboxylase [bacterium]HQJ65025.1 archaetidylserine decarboxylase [bacterium]
MAEPLYYYRRGSGQKEEEIILGEPLMRWAYHSRPGKMLGALLFHRPWLSRLTGWLADTRWSRRQIARVIRDLRIDTAEFAEPPETYPTFNAFFSRRLKPDARPFAADPLALASPADGRVLVYPALQAETLLPVKGRSFTVDALLGSNASPFHSGSLAIVRLCPADYHRFHFPCDGRILEQKRIPGRFHSVNPLILALGIDVFGENQREVALLENDRLGRFAFIEVGAFGVGRIVQTHADPRFRKGEEKGYFEYGGSTIVLVFQPGRIEFAADLLEHSHAGYETFLKAGEELGRAAQ